MLCLGCISYQDFKDRRVYVFLFMALSALLFSIFYLESSVTQVFYLSIWLNLSLVGIFLLLTFLVTHFVFKKRFLNHSLGLGDILFFVCLALGFPTVTFIILFVCSLLFSLIVFLALKRIRKVETVPLAGLMASFLLVVMLYTLFMVDPSLYTF